MFVVSHSILNTFLFGIISLIWANLLSAYQNSPAAIQRISVHFIFFIRNKRNWAALWPAISRILAAGKNSCGETSFRVFPRAPSVIPDNNCTHKPVEQWKSLPAFRLFPLLPTPKHIYSMAFCCLCYCSVSSLSVFVCKKNMLVTPDPKINLSFPIH